jgi:hypothetical protein
MNILKANTTYGGRFTTQSADGVLTNAAPTPTASLLANGSVLADITVIVTNIITGIYTYSYSTPVDISYFLGRKVQVQLLATIGTNAGGCLLDEGYFDSVIGSDIHAAALTTTDLQDNNTTLIDGIWNDSPADLGELSIAVNSILDQVEADVVYDDSASPYKLIFKKKGTETVLSTKLLKDQDGNNVNSLNDFIAQQIEE